VSDFGDATDEDSYDPTAPPDPEAVVVILLLLLQAERGDMVRAMARLLARLRREGGLR
jgi:hypothetical protein